MIASEINPADYLTNQDYWNALGIRELLARCGGLCQGIEGEHSLNCDDSDEAVVEVRDWKGVWSAVSTYCLYAHDEDLYRVWTKEMT